jgi:hypothetical protein
MSVLAALLLAGAAAACTGPAPAQPRPAASPPPDPDNEARSALAARAALAQDRRFAALYHFDASGAAQRNVVATVATDGSWRVDIADGALGGTADVSVVSNSDGVYQCSLPSVTNPISPGCVRVADAGKRIPRAYDPEVQRLFRSWLGAFMDRQSALAVTPASALPGAGTGATCFAVDSISASLNPPVDIGIYCYAADGLLTAAKVDFGVLTIASTPVAPPATVQLPGPVGAGPPLGMASPPPPPPTPSAPSASPISAILELWLEARHTRWT